jgi:hypothetical protein
MPQAEDDKGTPARDHHDAEAFEATDETVSDQQGETAQREADKPRADEAHDDDGKDG